MPDPLNPVSMIELSGTDGISFLSLVIGTIGTVATIASAGFAYYVYVLNKRREATHSHVFELAAKDLKADEVEQRIDTGRKTLAIVAAKSASLQGFVESELPLLVRRTVLRDRLDQHQKAIADIAQSVQSIRDEMNLIGDDHSVPDDIYRHVESLLEPDYLKAQQRSHLKTQLTVVSTAAAAMYALLPYDLDGLAALLLLGVGGPILLRLADLVFGPTYRKFLRASVRWGGALVIAGLSAPLWYWLVLNLTYLGGKGMHWLPTLAQASGIIGIMALAVLWWMKISTWLLGPLDRMK